MNEIIGRVWLVEILEEIKAAGGMLDGVKLHLFKNDIQIGPGLLVSQLVEADYDGYAASAVIVWGEPFLDAGGNGLMVGDTKQFHPTGSVVTNDIYGYWMMPTVATTTPIKAVRFPSPQPMTGVLSAIIVTPTFAAPQL